MKQLSRIASNILLATLLLSSCTAPGKPADFDYGHVENGRYLNDFFKLEMILPDNWDVQSNEVLEELAEKGGELLAGDDHELKSSLDASRINVANLLGVTQNKLEEGTDFYASIFLVAENVSRSYSINNGSDYLSVVKELLERGSASYDFISEDFEAESIHGTTYYTMNTIGSSMGIEVKQTYYSTISKGFSFNAIITYVTEEQKDILAESIYSMKFAN